MHLMHQAKQREPAILDYPIRAFSWLQLPVLLLGWLRFLLAFKTHPMRWANLDGCHQICLAASY